MSEDINIILDTNIIQYLGNEDISKVLEPYILELNSRATLRISLITIYECLRGLKLQDEAKPSEILSIFNPYDIEKTVLIAASRLQTFYFHDKTIAEGSISIEDKIIAATAILTGSYVLTANVNDFPRPYFKEIERKNIIYTRKGKEILLHIQLLAPDIDYINKILANGGYS